VYRGGAASVYTSTRLGAVCANMTVMTTTNYEVAGQLFFGADVSRTIWSRDSKRATSF